jgi:hypothetical protein
MYPLPDCLFMLLLIILFGSYIINPLSRFISQQVQQIKLQLLVKEYSPLSMQRLCGSTPGTSTLSSIPCPSVVSTKELDESLPPSPKEVGYLSQRGDLLGLDT